MAVQPLTVKEAAERVIEKQEIFILDVRNENDFNDWKMEGVNFDYLNVPYFDLLDGVEEILDSILSNKDVLVVCAKEGSSIMVAEMLSDAGLDVFYLKGGMKAWSEYLVPIKAGSLKNGGEIYQFVRLGKGCLSYMVLSNGEAAVIDASRMTNHYLSFAKEKGVSITQVLDTHLHADHISGGRELAEMAGAAYWLPSKDSEGAAFEYKSLEEGNEITIDGTTVAIHTLPTPGHTAGSTSFIIDETFLLSGDILFIDSIGRPDLAGMAQDLAVQLRDSLYKQYKQLSADLIVLPAHFMTIEELNEDGSISEKLGVLFEKNHGLSIQNEKDFKRLVTEHLPPQPNAYQEIRETNLGKINPDEEEQREMEIGPNRCAVRS
ncbi:MBL fold metallo-hydrolase [Metabacillus sp. RGM 3146]|uniref:MBL fold metallo-hydrolase n=1 Tax=Metabacillus sp. RGM 3146 TaxID=3401092 RepID=UPI003B99879F